MLRLDCCLPPLSIFLATRLDAGSLQFSIKLTLEPSQMKKFGGTVKIKSITKSWRTKHLSQNKDPSLQFFSEQQPTNVLAQQVLLLNSYRPTAQRQADMVQHPVQPQTKPKNAKENAFCCYVWRYNCCGPRTRIRGLRLRVRSFIICVNVRSNESTVC